MRIRARGTGACGVSYDPILGERDVDARKRHEKGPGSCPAQRVAGDDPDNMKGMARKVEIEEPVHEIGSIYVHKIAFAVLEDGSFEPITLSPSQQKRADWLIAFDRLSATEV